MLRSGYIVLYLLKSLKLEMTTAAHPHTRDISGDETMFPDNGPVFMHNINEVTYYPMRGTLKAKRRFEDYDMGHNAPPAFGNNAGGIQTGPQDYKPLFMDQFIDTQPSSTKNIEEINDPRMKAYDDIIENLHGTSEIKPDLGVRTDDFNAATGITNEKRSDPPVNDLNYPKYAPKIFDDIYSMDRESSTQRLRDFLTNELPFVQNYDEFTSDKNFRAYDRNEEGNEPIFVEDFSLTPQTTESVPIFNKTVLRKMQDLLYPVEKKLGGKRIHTYRKNGGLEKKPTIKNKSKASTKRSVGDRKARPAVIQKSDALRKVKPVLRKNNPLSNDLAFRQVTEQPYPIPTDRTFERMVKSSTFTNENQGFIPVQLNLPSIKRIPGTPKKLSPFQQKNDVTQYLTTEIVSSNVGRSLKPLHKDYEVNTVYPLAEKIISSEFKDRPDGPKPPTVHKINRTPSFVNGSVTSFIVSLLNTKPASPKQIDLHEFIYDASKAPFTVTNLVSSSLVNVRSTATPYQPLSRYDRISYPWVTLSHPTTTSKPQPVVTTSTPLTTNFILRTTTEYPSMLYIPTKLEEYQEIRPEFALRVRSEPSTSVQQTFTTMKAIDAGALSERLKPQLDPVVIDKLELDTKIKDNINSRVVDKPEAIEVTEVHNLDGGTDPFSTFLRKLVKVLVLKDSKDLTKLIKPFERYVVGLLDGKKLQTLGIATGTFIAQLTIQLRLPVGVIKRFLAKVHSSLESRRRAAPDDINAMLDELDDVYDVSEEEAMQRVLMEINMFPDARRRAEQIVQDFVDDVFLNPMKRVEGTSRGNAVFESIAKAANQFNINNRRFGRHVGNAYVLPFSIHGDIGDILKKDNAKDNSYILPFSTTGDILKKDNAKNKKGATDCSTTPSLPPTSVHFDHITEKGETSKGRRQMVIDLYSSENSGNSKTDPSSSEEKNEIEIRIKINNAKHLEAKKLKRNLNETIARYMRGKVKKSLETRNREYLEKMNIFSKSIEYPRVKEEFNRYLTDREKEPGNQESDKQNQRDIDETIARYIRKRVQESIERRNKEKTPKINIFSDSSDSKGEDASEVNKYNMDIETDTKDDVKENQSNVEETIDSYIYQRVMDNFRKENKDREKNIFSNSESGSNIDARKSGSKKKSKRKKNVESTKMMW